MYSMDYISANKDEYMKTIGRKIEILSKIPKLRKFYQFLTLIREF